MNTNYKPFLQNAIEQKRQRQDESLTTLWDDPSVPEKMLRRMDCARGESFGILYELSDKSFVSRRDIESTLARLRAEVERRKGQHDPSDPDGFGTGIYVDAIQVLKEVLERGDEAEA